jgi:PHD/YefM family antitoxin component YafN of YafNO toxin-antitoxin module
MKVISELDAPEGLADLLDKAGEEPIVITRERKPDVALIAAEKLEVLRLSQEIHSLTRGKEIVIPADRIDGVLDALDAAIEAPTAIQRLRGLRNIVAEAAGTEAVARGTPGGGAD